MSGYESILPTTEGSEALMIVNNIAEPIKDSETLINMNRTVELTMQYLNQYFNKRNL